MQGIPFRYFSFTPERCRTLLLQYGIELIETHHDAGENSYYLARKVT